MQNEGNSASRCLRILLILFEDKGLDPQAPLVEMLIRVTILENDMEFLQKSNGSC